MKVGRQCSWVGVTGSGEEAFPCGKGAVGYVEAPDGRRIYTCEEHGASAMQRAGSERFVRSVAPDGRLVPPTYHAAVRQSRQNACVVGELA